MGAMEPDLTPGRTAAPAPSDVGTDDSPTTGVANAPWGPPTRLQPQMAWPPPVPGQAFDGRTPWHNANRVGSTSPGRRRAKIIGLIVAAVTVPTVVLGALIEPIGGTDTTSWDPRVTDLVAFVERERGLSFEHPVPIEFQTEEEFISRLGSGGPGEAPTDEQLADEANFYRALGLADDYDPSADQATLDEVLLLGYFDSFEDRVFVRGSELTPDVRTVLVHELTHVLQSQHFEFRLGGPDDLVQRSLLEGDAMRIEQRYIETLPADVRTDVEQAQTIDDTDAEDLAGVPWTVAEASYAPYVLGPAFIASIDAAGGNAGVDAALREPPTAEQLLDPLQYLDPPLSSIAVDQFPVEAGVPDGAETIWDSSPFGLFDALVMLDAWVPWDQARGALDGWVDAAIVVYREDDVVCNGITIRVDSRDAAERLAATVIDWGSASGSSVKASISQKYVDWPADVTFRPCSDDGRPTPPMPVFTTSYAVDFETWYVREELASDDGDRESVARCIARRLVDDPEFLELTEVAVWTSEHDDRYEGVTAELRLQCDRWATPAPSSP